ncbi:MAG: hypothetical protein IPL28_14695 [Chloroflexi bacterium]|nr:hypothetical protein [Chloroflexota bacterium]
MIGQQVEHPQFGAGQVVAIYRNGAEWLVRFENGLRFRRPRTEFENGRAPAPHSPIPHSLYQPPPPMPPDQREARHLIEALRLGIAPPSMFRS